MTLKQWEDACDRGDNIRPVMRPFRQISQDTYRRRYHKAEARKVSNPERDAVTWNAEISRGAGVNYRKDDGSIVATHTRSEAQVLGGHTAVVWLENVRGCVALDRVTPRETE